MKQKIFRVGKTLKDYNYPVINERSVRATAGLMLLTGIITAYFTLVQKNYFALQFTVAIFFVEFLLKTVFGPHMSIFGILGRWIVRKQEPEWIGAVQKKFAWGLGLIMAGSMLIVTHIYGLRGAVPMSFCGVCLSLMWLEATCGICVGCKIYWPLVKAGILKEPKHKPKCPGGVCKI